MAEERHADERLVQPGAADVLQGVRRQLFRAVQGRAEEGAGRAHVRHRGPRRRRHRDRVRGRDPQPAAAVRDDRERVGQDQDALLHERAGVRRLLRHAAEEGGVGRAAARGRRAPGQHRVHDGGRCPARRGPHGRGRAGRGHRCEEGAKEEGRRGARAADGRRAAGLQHRRRDPDDGRPGQDVLRKPQAEQRGGGRRRADHPRDQRAARVHGRRRAELPDAGPQDRVAQRRRGPADPAGDAGRQRAGRRLLRAGRAHHRPAPAGQHPPAADAPPPAADRQHGDHRRARRGLHPRGRPPDRHRPRGRQPRRERDGVRADAGCAPAEPEHHGPVPDRRAGHRPPRPTAGRSTRTGPASNSRVAPRTTSRTSASASRSAGWCASPASAGAARAR